MMTLYKRDGSLTPGAEWVVAGEGVATRMYFGLCCLVRNGQLFKRHIVQFYRYEDSWPGDPALYTTEPIPSNYEEVEFDEATLLSIGWVPVGPEDRLHREAWYLSENDRTYYEPTGIPSPYAVRKVRPAVDGTYELVGPKINDNPERFGCHRLVKHGSYILRDVPTSFDALRSYISTMQIEGVVWHHPDGRMVKMKGKDF